ncbi:mucin-19 [Pyrus ussuriensis x Pyrus communis]|uniref:Mucin-19 n=1 Tax=Pyrus ussuriensis x Pyrus communis TaxID=2448454 RepID=A0A5N5HNM1_9ROSA|nr:mucin-19 [Pyrus ussuriensis x Pyrus communis]
MASAAREEKQKQAYEGLGAGGKIRKTPFRRTTQATSYDRPPTILRNPLEPPTMAGSRSSSIRLSASSPPVPTANAFPRLSRLQQDFLDLDDDDDCNGVASDSRGKAEATSIKNTPVYSEVKTSASPTVFAASWQPGKSPVFATAFNSTSLSTGLSYVASSVAPATNSAPIVSRGSSIAVTTCTNSVPFGSGGSSTAAATTNNVSFVFGGSSSAAATTISAPITFGGSTVSSTNNNSGSLFSSSNGASSTSMFSFTSTAPTSAPSQPPFGNSNPVFPFGSPGNNDQLNMKDSNQASTPTAPVFGQQFQFGQLPILNSPSASVFVGPNNKVGKKRQFGGTLNAPAASPFQFAGQQNLTNPQNPNPFQASGSLGVNQGLGGSFSVGSSGGDGDKSHRRIIKVKHNRPRKK